MGEFGTIQNWINLNSTLYYFPKIGISDLIEIFLLTVIFYYIVKSLKGTRAWVLLKGVIIMLAFYMLAYLLDFTVITFLFQNIILFIGIAIVVIIQPELRKLIEHIGTKNINVSLKNIIHSIFRDKAENKSIKLISDLTIQELVKGCFTMGKAKTGALIVIEGDIPLNEYVDSGIAVDANITSQLLINIFEKNTPLHDGAVIVQKDRITAATCYLPLSDSKKINKDLGTRHRAGIGISECTDAFVIIVSEETGEVSVSYNGELLHNLDREKLSEELKKLQRRTEKKIEVDKKIKNGINNVPLKAACLVGTLLLWYMVITSVNPVVSTTVNNIPIELINVDSISDTGKTFEILNTDKVSVTIKDRKDVIDRLKTSDIKVVADFSKLSYVNSIPLEVSILNHPDSEVTLSESTLQISMEDVITTEVGIEVDRVGEASDKYYISDIELNTETLIISGAKSVINTIGSVKVEIDESKLTLDEKLNLVPIIYDKNGEVINTDRLTLSHPTVEATVHLYKTKRVPLNINTTIENKVLASIITNIEYEQNTIYITGTDEVLERFSSIDIEVPIDITLGEIVKSQFIKNINVSDFLPEEIIVVPQYDKVSLTIDFVNFYTKSIEFNTSLISIDGLNENLKATMEQKTFNVDIVGTSKSIENKQLSDIKPYIDVTNLQAGNYDLTVKFKDMSENIFGNLVVKVTIEDKG